MLGISGKIRLVVVCAVLSMAQSVGAHAKWSEWQDQGRYDVGPGLGSIRFWSRSDEDEVQWGAWNESNTYVNLVVRSKQYTCRDGRPEQRSRLDEEIQDRVAPGAKVSTLPDPGVCINQGGVLKAEATLDVEISRCYPREREEGKPWCSDGAVAPGEDKVAAATKGSLSQSNFAAGVCQVASMQVRYEVSMFFGEPIVKGSYKWEAAGGTDPECLTGDTKVAIELLSSTNRTAFVHIAPAVPKSGAGWGYNVSGSPNWDGLFCGRTGAPCLSESEAKAFYKAGFSARRFHVDTTGKASKPEKEKPKVCKQERLVRQKLGTERFQCTDCSIVEISVSKDSFNRPTYDGHKTLDEAIGSACGDGEPADDSEKEEKDAIEDKLAMAEKARQEKVKEKAEKLRLEKIRRDKAEAKRKKEGAEREARERRREKAEVEKMKAKAEASGTVTSRSVTITVRDHNSALDDYFDLYVNNRFIGKIRNRAGGSTTYKATLEPGENVIELRLSRDNDNGTALTISISPGGFRKEFRGTHDHVYIITAPR